MTLPSLSKRLVVMTMTSVVRDVSCFKQLLSEREKRASDMTVSGSDVISSGDRTEKPIAIRSVKMSGCKDSSESKKDV